MHAPSSSGRSSPTSALQKKEEELVGTKRKNEDLKQQLQSAKNRKIEDLELLNIVGKFMWVFTERVVEEGPYDIYF